MLLVGSSAPTLINRLVSFQKTVMRTDIYQSAQMHQVMYAKNARDTTVVTEGYILCGTTVCGSQDVAKLK